MKKKNVYSDGAEGFFSSFIYVSCVEGVRDDRVRQGTVQYLRLEWKMLPLPARLPGEAD